MITLILATIFPKGWEPGNVWFLAMFEILLESVLLAAMLHLVFG